MIEPPAGLPPGVTVEPGPTRVRNELWWSARLGDGRAAVLAQLAPELAADEAVRRRYVHDAVRVAGLDAPSLVPTLTVGPAPDPRDPSAAPPWRLRLAPAGETLEAWIARRAPAPVDEALELAARLADAMHAVHARGATLRDLEPRSVVLAANGAVWLADVGLARTDILSSRTASSLVLETSPYAAPEHLRATVVDLRADLFTLGAILWRMLTGTLPFGDGASLLRRHDRLPALASVCPGAPAGLDELVRRCLAEDPEERPASARELADALRGRPGASPETALVPVTCQACGETLRPGLRLCLSCGREAVQLFHVGVDEPRWAVLLREAKEEVTFLSALEEETSALAADELPPLDFMIGHHQLYSKEERSARIGLPVRLFSNLSRPTAEAIASRYRERGVKVKVERVRRPLASNPVATGSLVGGFVLAGMSVPLFAAAGAWGLPILMLGIVLIVFGFMAKARLTGGAATLAALRPAPAALPASDPLVARLSGALRSVTHADVRARLSEVALLVQRLVDHRAQVPADAAAEVTLVTEPLDRLVGRVCDEATAIGDIDRELASLDEGTLVRGIAASEMRGDPPARRAELLVGLDRLRALEDRRAAHMQRLLEASSLLGRTVSLGLAGGRDARALDNEVTMALAALGESTSA